MVATDSEALSGEVESALQSDQQSKAHQLPSLGRQSSIYSLTLDEFQHTLSESGKNFGSMNMDEFLTSIWNAEENQANITHNVEDNGNNNGVSNNEHVGNGHEKGISKQPSLPRQGSLTLPPPLCRKTVDEVWSEIHRTQHGENNSGGAGGGSGNAQNPETSQRQPTFVEMTLEDFLIKAGVVREQGNGSTRPMPIQPQTYLYPGGTNTGAGYVSRPVLGLPPGAAGLGEPSGRNGGFVAAAPPAAGVYGGGSAYGAVSPVSSEGLVGGVDNAGNQYGLDLGGLRGRKRIIDGPVEKVVERRQRRMIKNRESAARSRARKQAYTVELEAELNQLKEENKQLKQTLVELERKRKQQYFEEMRMKAQTNEEMRMRGQTRGQKAKERLKMLRRNMSCPL